MSDDSWPRVELFLLFVGVLLMGLPAASITNGGAQTPGWELFVLASFAAGVALGLWGWARLQRAKAARPDRPWFGFVYTGDSLWADLIGVGVGVVVLATVALISEEQRAALFQSLLEVAHMLVMLRGHHG